MYQLKCSKCTSKFISLDSNSILTKLKHIYNHNLVHVITITINKN